jgi:hypothetical protein
MGDTLSVDLASKTPTGGEESSDPSALWLMLGCDRINVDQIGNVGLNKDV